MIHVLKASSCYSWMPLHLKCSALNLFKTKKGIWSLYNWVFLLIGCIVLFKKPTWFAFCYVFIRVYKLSVENAVRLANGEQPGFRQMPIKAGKPISSDIAKHGDDCLLEFSLEWKCCRKGLVLSAVERRGWGSTWGAQVWHSWTASSFEQLCGCLREAGAADN